MVASTTDYACQTLVITITIISTIVFVQLNKLANKVLFDRMFKFVESR